MALQVLDPAGRQLRDQAPAPRLGERVGTQFAGLPDGEVPEAGVCHLVGHVGTGGDAHLVPGRRDVPGEGDHGIEVAELAYGTNENV